MTTYKQKLIGFFQTKIKKKNNNNNKDMMSQK